MQENVSLAPFTTLGIGGPARYFIRAGCEGDVLEAVHFAGNHGLPLLVLGGGSNLVVADAGFPGVVLRIEIGGRQWIDQGDRVHLTAGAGEDWDGVVSDCVARSLYGVECLSGIPGSVGGTPVQNVGAYGQEVASTLVRVRACDRRTGRVVELAREECGFGYRSSIFNTTARDRFVVVTVTYSLATSGTPSVQYPELRRELEGGPEPTLAGVRAAVCRIRARKSMLLQAGDPDARSAGSFFKNPVITPERLTAIEARSPAGMPRYPTADGRVKLAAAWLIEQAGIARGDAMGRVAVSRKHTLALVNLGGASAAELLDLARHIRTRVEARFGIGLATEPVFVGFDASVADEFRSEQVAE